jgi:capsular polysaccharide biosynthesis protein
MDLLSILRTIWRRRLVAIPVILLTALGGFYVFSVKKPVYEASASLLLLSPPSPPTATQIAADRKLANIKANNPYVNFGYLPIVADAVISVVTSASSQQALVQAGADPRDEVGLSTAYGTPPIIQITGVGSSPQEAIRTANLVTTAAVTALYNLQKAQGVTKTYMIKSVVLVRPHQAQQSLSGKLRTFVAVLGLGALLLLIVISVVEALDKQRRTAAAYEDDGTSWDKRPARAFRADVAVPREDVESSRSRLRRKPASIPPEFDPNQQRRQQDAGLGQGRRVR